MLCGPRVLLIDPIFDAVREYVLALRFTSIIKIRVRDPLVRGGHIRMRLAIVYDVIDLKAVHRILADIERILRSHIIYYIQEMSRRGILDFNNVSRIEKYLHRELGLKLENFGIRIYSVEIIEID